MKMLWACILFASALAAGCSSDPAPQAVSLDRSFNPPLGYTLFTPGDGFSSRGVEAGLQSFFEPYGSDTRANGLALAVGTNSTGKAN